MPVTVDLDFCGGIWAPKTEFYSWEVVPVDNGGYKREPEIVLVHDRKEPL